MKKTMNIVVRLAAAAVMMLGFGKAYAFHSGGVAECGGCHSMHSPKAGGFSLLIGSDQSSTCLECHAETGVSSYHISTPEAELAPGLAPYQKTPGGDFSWLRKTYSWSVRGTTNYEYGSSHGHNIVAADFNYAADPSLTTAPGGNFPSAQLACTSCHDMHGQSRRTSTGAIVRGGTVGFNGGPIISSGSYNNSPGNSATNLIPAGQAVGVYRLLFGPGSTATGGAIFTGVPAAVAPSTYNRFETATQTRVAYGVASTGGHQTWGNWCGTCHPAMHSTGNYVHPVDQNLGTAMAAIYSGYVSSGNLSGTFSGAQAGQGPFLSLAPFATGSASYVTLGGLAAAGASTSLTSNTLAGPATNDQVTCLSCHRAHASGFPEMLRWQQEGEFITVADTTGSAVAIWPGTDNGAPVQFARGRTAAEQQAAYYGRPAAVFGVYQRVLCNKCHARD